MNPSNESMSANEANEISGMETDSTIVLVNVGPSEEADVNMETDYQETAGQDEEPSSHMTTDWSANTIEHNVQLISDSSIGMSQFLILQEKSRDFINRIDAILKELE